MSKSGIVYKLCCVDTDISEIYIGSTKNFNRRRTNHKSICNNENDKRYNYPVYQFIRANRGFNNWRMIQLETVNYDTKRDLEAHERRWIEQLKPELNKLIPLRTIKEWYEQNRDKLLEQMKEHYEQNKEKKKEFYEQNKDKLNEYKRQKVKCIYCDTEYRRSDLSKHNKTGRHIYNYIYY